MKTQQEGAGIPESAAFLRLMMMASPTFPVGGFAYSHGLEQAAADGLVSNGADLADWLAALLVHGAPWNDAVLLCESWRQAEGDLAPLAELAEALAGSHERHLESHSQGAAFIAAARAAGFAVPLSLPTRTAYPVAFGSVARFQGIRAIDAAAAFAQAFVSNQIQCAIRLSVLGQAEGVALLAGFECRILGLAECAAASTLDDLGGAAFQAEIAAMRHETLHSRIFRS